MMNSDRSRRIPPEAYMLLAGLGEDVLEDIITDFWTSPEFHPEI
jgi:hypothetical protein